MAGGPGVLETPTYICSAVFAVFLLLSLIIDKVIHKIQEKLGESKRKRLKTAFSHIMQELMLMGLMSLVLIVAQDFITGICIKERSVNSTWVLLHQVDECNPCLERTKTLSDHFKHQSHCPFWESSDDYSTEKHSPSSGHDSETPESTMSKMQQMLDTNPTSGSYEESWSYEERHGRKLFGGGSDEVCKEGYTPFVSVAVLHEVHIFIFLLGVTHVLTSVIMILISSFRTILITNRIAGDETHTDLVAKHVRGESGSSLPSSSGRMGSSSLSEQLLSDVEDGKSSVVNQKRGLENWTAPDRDMSKFHNVILEYIISFVKQFVKPISTEEFQLMRASFMINHKRVTNFDFMDYIMAGLDDDFIKVVKMNLNRGLTVALFILLLGPVDWTSWQCTIVMIVLFLLPIIVTTKLVYIVRHVTRGGCVHKLDANVFWFRRPKLLLPAINFILFMCSLALGSVIFFLWQFGEFSCVFYGHSPGGKFGSADWTWIVGLTAIAASYAHLTLVTLPTYSIVVHMGDIHWHKDLIPHQVQEKILKLAGKAKKNFNLPKTSTEVGKENHIV